MTQTQTRPHVPDLAPAHVPAAPVRPPSGRGTRRRRSAVLRRLPHLDGSWWVGALLALAAATAVGIVHARGMYTAPVRFDDEGTYVDQALSLLHEGELSPYTYWYDHPPLGWMILSVWLAGPALLWDAPNAIGDGRQLMLVLDVVAAVLLFILARRLGLSRLAGAGAALAFGLSPLALSYHRMVLLDNLATPLVLGAMVLALSPRKKLSAALGAGLAFAAAVLVKETVLLMLPFVAWLLWRNVSPSTRRMSVTVFAIGLVMLGVLYPLFAVLKGELLPGPDRVSLWDAVQFQLFERQSSGSVLQAGSDAYGIVTSWLDLDPYLLVAGAVLTVPALAVHKVRPVAAALLLLLLMMLRPGYLPVPYVIALLPLAALVVAGVCDAVVRSLPLQRLRENRLRAVDALAAVMVVAVAAVAAVTVTDRVVPAWRTADRVLMTQNADKPYQQATDWLLANVPRDKTLLVDNVVRTDLVEAGYSSRQAVWFTKLDVDPAVDRQHGDWRSFDYVVSSEIMRTLPGEGPSLDRALQNSKPVASFGHGPDRIVVRKIQ